jgi:hypothetical protein
MNLNSSFFRRSLAGMVFLLLLPLALLAQPSPRTTAAMVFDETASRVILFGGATPAFIRGEEQFARDYIAETWAWNGRRWYQLFPAGSPSGRGGHAFVWDSNADRAILFGGLTANGVHLDDTWEFRGSTWTRIETPAQPSPRKYPAAAFDRVRNKIVLYGGSSATAVLRDTWEFNGTTWTKTGDDGPDVTAAVLVYDGTRDETLLLGMKSDSTTVMYRYTHPGWEQMTPATLPICLSRAVAVWQEHAGNVLLYGGACGTGLVPAVSWEWDGTTWKAVEGSLSAGRVYGHAMAYDSARGETVLVSGTDFDLGYEVNFTYRYRNSKWQSAWTFYNPGPRSLFGFTSDPERGAVWLYGGVRGVSDLWKYAYGQWNLFPAKNAPSSCTYPLTAWDSDRKVMVLLCSDASIYEFDGNEWKTFTTPDKRPATSIQASMVYDATLKKTVVYGGYNGNYVDETWTWDGSKWAEIEGKDPHFRGLAMMFYDPISKKTVLYGGVGRTQRDGTLVRFADTWTFNGKDWVEATSVNSPPSRYGAAIAFNPADNKVHMFGGTNEKVEFIAEHWVWDGAKWSKVDGGTLPPARMNARMAWDPTLQQFVLFGGYAGYYLSDLWVLEGTTWRPVQEQSGRQRIVALPGGGSAGSASAPATAPRGRAAARW